MALNIDCGKHVFISYSSKEMEVATKVCTYLEANGIPCWIAPRNVDAGSNYASQIVSALKQCEILVLLASENTNASGHVSNEVSIAFDNKKIIIPFKLQDFNFTDEYLYFLGRKHWIEAHKDFNASLIVLKETIFALSDVFTENEKTINVEANPEKNIRIVDNDLCESEYTRDSIVDLIIEKSLKFPYNIYSKINTEDSYFAFLKSATQMFKETVTAYHHNKIVTIDDNIINLIVEDLSNGNDVAIQVHGLPGSAKNMILQLAFYKMLDNFKKGNSNTLPYYVSSSHYEKIPYNPQNVAEQMRDILGKEFKEYFNYIKENPNIKPVLFIEAIREHNVAKISPENIVFDLWKHFGRFNRICAIDVGLIKNRSKLKRVIPIVGDSKGYTFITKQVPIDNKESAINLITSVFGMYDYELDVFETYKCLKKLKFPTIDIFLVRLIAKEMLSMYGQEEIALTDIYEKLALSELYGDVEQLKIVAEELNDYVFDQSYAINSAEYNAVMWSLPHKHNTYLEFLLAFYFVYRIENFRNYKEHRFFATLLTAMSNHFMVSFLKDNYSLQETLLEFITENYEIFDVQQKSNAVYWLGRITYKNLANEAITMLTKEFTKYKSLVKTNNKSTQENCNNHYLFRAICTGLLFQGQANMMDEYLSIVVANDIANAINRGATIEYFGDDYQMVAHDAYYLDTDLSTGEQAIKIINTRIESALYGNTGKFVENNLVTMLTLLQARIQNVRTNLKFDIKPYVIKALKYLKDYQSRPQNIVSSKLLYYFQSVEEDLKLYMDSGSFDIGSLIYNKYRGLKQIKRSQWLAHDIYDPESVSEHSYSAWLMAMLFLPEEHHSDGYCKKEILDMLLVHDMAEAAIGDQKTSLSETKKELKEQNDILKKLFLKGTYPDIANLTYYYNVWTGYYNGVNTNARTARDINLLQSVYTFCEYYCAYPEQFTDEDVKFWMHEKSNLKTEIGYQLFERLIINNNDFKAINELCNDNYHKSSIMQENHQVESLKTSPSCEYSIMRYEDILNSKGDIESIKREISAIIKSVITSEDNGYIDSSLAMLEKISENWRVIINSNGELVAYWVFVALQEDCFERAKEGVLNEAEITVETIEFIDFPGTYKGYLLLSGVKPEARNSTLVQLCYDSLILHFEHLASKGIFFDEICSVGESPAGISSLKKMGLKEIGLHKFGGRVFHGDFSKIAENRFLIRFEKLQKLYQEYFKR